MTDREKQIKALMEKVVSYLTAVINYGEVEETAETNRHRLLQVIALLDEPCPKCAERRSLGVGEKCPDCQCQEPDEYTEALNNTTAKARELILQRFHPKSKNG